MRDNDCIFCKIVAGEIPAVKVAETERCIAILDAFPVTKGHTLVIPKDHSVDVFGMSDADLEDAIKLLRDVAAGQKKTYDCPGINLVKNIGATAGQAVFHSHFHSIPRFGDDNFNVYFGDKLEFSESERQEIAAEIKNNMPQR